MNLLRIMLSTLVLLAQAWPASAAIQTSNDSASCVMGCCDWLAEAEMVACACDAESLPAAPARTPPASGRDLVPQVSWVPAEHTPPFSLSARSLTEAKRGTMEHAVATLSHVRLPVLFCSFLN